MLTNLQGLMSIPFPTPQENLIKNFKDTQLKFDPLYLAINLGPVIVSTSHSLNQGFPKVSFCDKVIKISLPEPIQGLFRTINGEGRHQLRLIRPHCIKLLLWIDYTNALYRPILNAYKNGMTVLIEGYEKEKGVCVSSSPNITEAVLIVDPDTQLILQDLKKVRSLLEQALKEITKSSDTTFFKKLKKQERIYFPYHYLPTEEGPSIDDIMKQEVSNMWSEETIKKINDCIDFKTSDSIPNHIEHIPDKFTLILQQIHHRACQVLKSFDLEDPHLEKRRKKRL